MRSEGNLSMGVPVDPSCGPLSLLTPFPVDLLKGASEKRTQLPVVGTGERPIEVGTHNTANCNAGIDE